METNITIPPFDPASAEVQTNLERILRDAPVKNLNEAEVLTTLRLIQIHALLTAGGSPWSVCVHRNDARLAPCSDEDRFLALLLDCDLREALLGTRRCRQCFGGTPYQWRKVARRCAITDTASAVSDCGTGYYGRGWVIAPHIARLRQWIVENSTNEDIRRLGRK